MEKIKINNSRLIIDLTPIKTFAEKIGKRYPFLLSIYLYGSVARGDADKESDIDILIIAEGNPSEIYLILFKDEDYKNLEDWAFEIVEGGLSILICNEKEITQHFDTLINKILIEGILLHGTNLEVILSKYPTKHDAHESNLLDLMKTL